MIDMKGLNAYLTFKIGDELFAIQVERVHNIMELSHLTTDHYKKSFVAGSINFRGTTIPVIDMRMKFDLPHNDFLKSTCVIVVDVNLKIEKIIVGILVDALYEVIEIGEAIDQSKGKLSLLKGIFQKTDGSIFYVIDPDKMFSEFEIEVIKSH
jgi:purine-binding chemotaxis protein CheW